LQLAPWNDTLDIGINTHILNSSREKIDTPDREFID
jgi:hypothetical protein